MNKNKTRSIILLAVVLAAFLCLALLIPFARTATYWLGFIAGLVSIAVSTIGVCIAFGHAKDAKSKFYGFPIAKLSVIYLIVQIAVSFILMGIASFAPAWPGIIVCVILFILAVIGLIAVDVTRDEIERQDDQQKVNTENMMALRSKAVAIVGLCNDEETKKQLQKLSDNLKYSDPVSSEAVSGIEHELEVTLDELQQAVMEGDTAAAEELCRRAQEGLVERNRVCRLHK